MVDVGAKATTVRVAVASCVVQLPADVAAALGVRGSGGPEGDSAALVPSDTTAVKKGCVLTTATIAAVMAAKRTPDLIPLCHPLALDGVDVRYSTGAGAEDGATALRIECEVRTTGKTGVEMEALVGVSTAALTVYDMLKAVSHDIVIDATRLEGKSGGKRHFDRSSGSSGAGTG
jgi:cyclic pyranopterin phosphate synthase